MGDAGNDIAGAYATLGLPEGASNAEVHAAYRRLAKVVHPDGGGDKFTFAELQSAYDLLCEVEQDPRTGSTKRGAEPASADRADTGYADNADLSSPTWLAGCLYRLLVEGLATLAFWAAFPLIVLVYRRNPVAGILVGLTTALIVALYWLRSRGQRRQEQTQSDRSN